jgi:cytochrome c-type biogenesis protein CcmH
MILWIVLTIMTALAAVIVATPFIRRFERQRLGSGDVAVYRDQLKEVENELRLGQLEPSQAESAKVELKKRLLAADHLGEPMLPGLSGAEKTAAAIGVTGIVVLGSVALFALTANLEPPANSLVASEALPVAAGEAPLATSALPPTPAPRAAAGKPASNALPPVEEMIERLVTRLQRNPKDTEGWRTLGWSYYSTDHFTEAAVAYARAIELNPRVAAYYSARADSLAKAENGVMTDDAKAAVEEALKLDPKDGLARFLDGLTKQQAGDTAAAFKEWNDLLASLGPNQVSGSDLKTRIAELMPQAGRDSGEAVTAGRSSANAPEGRGPGPEDIKRAESLSSSDRTAMIRGMVDSLANRLAQSPRDADGWIKLIRSRTVLGETDAANQALARALKIFSDDAPERARIAAAAEQLGLSP